MVKKRDSGIELLRIIAILMVIGIHVFLYGNYYEAAEAVGGIVGASAVLVRMLLRPAVNIFVMITGYFMVRAKFDLRKSYKRVLRVYLSVYFYSVVLSLLTLIAGPEHYTVDGVTTPVHIIILKMLFPVLAQNWYFLSDYILLALFAPFVNIILQNISKKHYQILIALSSALMSLWFVLADIKIMEEVVRTYGFKDLADGKNLFSFIYLYIIGGYIRLYVKKNEHVRYRYLLIVFACVLVNWVLATKLQRQLGFNDVALRYTNPLVILMAVYMLMFFKDLNFYSHFVNLLASATLGVYAIHEFKYVRLAIWNKFNFLKIDCSNLLLNIMYIISIILIIFVVCTLIELLRQRLFLMCERMIKNKEGRS